MICFKFPKLTVRSVYKENNFLDSVAKNKETKIPFKFPEIDYSNVVTM